MAGAILITVRTGVGVILTTVPIGAGAALTMVTAGVIRIMDTVTDMVMAIIMEDIHITIEEPLLLPVSDPVQV